MLCEKNHPASYQQQQSGRDFLPFLSQWSGGSVILRAFPALLLLHLVSYISYYISITCFEMWVSILLLK